MAKTKLKNLEITKVDFVDAGANPKANVMLYKNESGKPGSKESKTVEVRHGSVLKRFVSAIGKAVGLKPEEIDATVEEIEKGGAETFGDKLAERKRRQIGDEIWDLCYALQSSLCSIIFDDEVADNAQELMQNSLDQFSATMTQAIGPWASGNTTSIKKSSEPITEEAINFMQYSKGRIEDMIVKAVGAKKVDDKGSEVKETKKSKGEEFDMSKVDKSQMTPAERAFFEDIEKRYSVDGNNLEKADSKGKASSEEENDDKSEGKEPKVKKAANTSATEDIYSGLHPAVAAELQRLQKRADEADEKELTDIAKKYEIIGKKPEELVPVLKSLKSAGGTAYAEMISLLDASVEAVNKSSMFTEIGKSGGYGTEPDAWTKIEKKADEIQQTNPTMTRAAAIDNACQLNPQLVHEYENAK